MTVAQRAKLDGIEAGAEVNPGEATTTDAGLMSASDKAKLDGVAAGAHVNIQPDWSETDSTAQDFIQNKPDSVTDFDVPAFAGNNGLFLTLRAGALTWGPALPVTDATLTGGGTAASPLSVARPYPAADAAKLAGIAAGAEVNVQSDWSENDASDPAHIANRPDFLLRAASDGTLTGDGTTAQPLSVASEFTPAEKTKLAGVAANADASEQPDWNESDSASKRYIRNKPTVLSQSDVDARVVAGTEVWARDDTTAVPETKIPAAVARDSEVTAAVSAERLERQTAVAGEASSRAAAIRTLTGRVAAEETARASGDTALGGRVTSEATARASADTALGTRISDEVTARTTADTALDGKITAEATARANEDRNLNNRITGEANNRAAADNALRGRVTALESAPAPNAFNLHDDVSGELTSLADDDRLLVSDVSEPGDPNKWIARSNARNDLSGWLGPWSGIPAGGRIRQGETCVHAEAFWISRSDHPKSGVGPDNSPLLWSRLDYSVEEYVTGSVSWPEASVVFDASGSLWRARQYIAESDPAPSDPANRKWDRLTWFEIPASALDADTPAKKQAFRAAIEAAGADTVIVAADTTYDAAATAGLNGRAIWAVAESDITITLTQPVVTTDVWFEIKAAAPYETGNVTVRAGNPDVSVAGRRNAAGELRRLNGECDVVERGRQDRDGHISVQRPG